MADRRPIVGPSDDDLGAALHELATTLLVPLGPAPSIVDPARLARLRLEAEPRPGALPWAWRPTSRGRLRRSAVLALVALVILAAIAGAIGLGVPGIRLVPAGSGSPPFPSPTGSATSSGPPIAGVLGAGLGLGSPIEVAAANGAVGFSVALPDEPAIGPPASAWLQAVPLGDVPDRVEDQRRTVRFVELRDRHLEEDVSVWPRPSVGSARGRRGRADQRGRVGRLTVDILDGQQVHQTAAQDRDPRSSEQPLEGGIAPFDPPVDIRPNDALEDFAEGHLHAAHRGSQLIEKWLLHPRQRSAAAQGCRRMMAANSQ